VLINRKRPRSKPARERLWGNPKPIAGISQILAAPRFVFRAPKADRQSDSRSVLEKDTGDGMIIEGHVRVRMPRSHFRWLLFIGYALSAGSLAGVAQQSPSLPDAPEPQIHDNQPAPAPENSKGRYADRHILWILPNYRDDDSKSAIVPLTPGQKFHLALDDSFDPSAFLVAGFFGGISMAKDEYHPFGQGAKGFSKYYGGAFADQAIGNFMTEGILPTVLHQDPRYFNKGTGGFWKRTGYAISREVVTRNDNGHNGFNTSEILGNGIAAGISNIYYPAADRTIGKTTGKWGQQLGMDTAFNVMKEFWPDIRHKFFGK